MTLSGPIVLPGPLPDHLVIYIMAWVVPFELLATGAETLEEALFWEEFEEGSVAARSGFSRPPSRVADFFSKYKWLLGSGGLTAAGAVGATLPDHKGKVKLEPGVKQEPGPEVITGGGESTDDHLNMSGGTRSVSQTNALLHDIKGQLSNHGKLAQFGPVKKQTLFRKVAQHMELSDPGIWQTRRKLSENIYTSQAGQTAYYLQDLLSKSQFDVLMGDYYQIGATTAENPQLNVQDAGIDRFKRVICEAHMNSRFHFKNNYAYEVNLIFYQLTPKDDLVETDNLVTDLFEAGIDDLYQGTGGNETSPVHYLEHSPNLLNSYYIYQKSSLRLLPGEVGTLSMKAHGFYNQDFDRDYDLLKYKSRVLCMRMLGGIGHDTGVSAVGYTATKLDMIRIDTTTFRFFNAGKQLKYNFITDGLSAAAVNAAVQEEAKLEVDATL